MPVPIHSRFTVQRPFAIGIAVVRTHVHKTAALRFIQVVQLFGVRLQRSVQMHVKPVQPYVQSMSRITHTTTRFQGVQIMFLSYFGFRTVVASG